MLKLRLLTAILLVPLVICGIFFLPVFYFNIICFLVTVYAAWEWSRLIGFIKLYQRALFTLGIAVVLMVAPYANIKWVLISGFFWWLLASYWIAIYPNGDSIWSNRFVAIILAIEVLTACWLSITLLRGSTHGAELMMTLLLMIWAADSCAYFAGKQWGIDKLAPHVSPGKTWQGVYGGIAGSMFIACLGGFYLKISGWDWLLWLGLCLVTSVMSVIGDLLFSMLKRKQGLKDTGNILPGHGGLLDRIDSLTAAAPVFILGLLLLHI